MKGRTAAPASVVLAALLAAPGVPDAGEPAPAPAEPATAAPAADAAPVAPEATVDAVWVELERSFVYIGQTTYYSCYGLRDKVRYVLERVGARPDLKVTTSCVESGGMGVEALPAVRIKAAFPAGATPERLAEFEKQAPRRELVARVQGRSADEELAPFPAVWRRVEFKGRGPGRIDDGDCELLDQLVERVLRPAGVRVAEESRLACMRRQIPIGSVRLVVDTLQKAPEPDTPPAQ